jgi:signal transduction histidine kinase
MELVYIGMPMSAHDSSLATSAAPKDAEQNDGLRAIVERIPDGIAIVGLDGTILFANPAAEKIFGRPLQKLAGTALGIPTIAGEAAEIEVRQPRGGIVTAELRAADIDWEGRPVRLIALRDISDRKRAEERAVQLQRERLARAEAEASSQAKSEFLATMSHELRTPLNAVIGYSELLDLGIAGTLSTDQHKQITRIRDSARHLLGLVNEILDLARVEAGKLTVQSEAAGARETIDSAIALAQPIAESRGILLTNCDSSADIQYQGDEDRVRQILINLLNNAIKFTSAGGSVTIDCGTTPHRPANARLSDQGPWVTISVVDTGIGIPADRLASIFDPFVQVQTGHTRSKDGSGLGLTISRRLARLMGGDLVVQSEPGKGSTFTLWLREATVAQREAARWRAEAPDTAARLHGLGDVGEALLREIPALVESVVSRLRAEAMVPGAITLRRSQLADHLAAYVADLASMLAAIEEARGQPSRLVAEAAEIQLYVAERHGAQRARLGWTTDIMRLEWRILGEELERIVRRGSMSVPEGAAAEALIVLDRVLEQAMERSTQVLEREVLRSAQSEAG